MDVKDITDDMIDEIVEMYVENDMYSGQETRNVIISQPSKVGQRGRPPLEDATYDLMGVEMTIKRNGLTGGPFNTQEEAKQWITDNYEK